MKIKCLLGRHRAIKDYSNWKRGYHVSACAECGVEMRSYGSEWEVGPKKAKSN
ncbi:hypothetical protein ACFQRC_08220 [Enterovirga sp. GCM10030262]|uniref:hypothetical protein n=1 Tax=Enterovirga sp. GCM10030262 TaxID=3273391 RepID=UPI00361307C6